jgi:ketosteroid isomerase-like protein
MAEITRRYGVPGIREKAVRITMKRHWLNLFLLISVLPPSAVDAQTVRPRLPSDAEQELRDLTRRWDEALVRRDIDVLDTILSNDYTFGGTTKAEYLDSLKMPGMEYSNYERTDISSRIYGDTALLRGRVTVSGKYPGVEHFNSTFNFIDVWIKQNDQWKCVATMHDQILGAASRGRVRGGPDIKAGLVVVFKIATTDRQINEFWRSVLQMADQSERNHRFRDGIRSASRVPPIEGQEALAISYDDAVTQAQKEDLKTRIEGASPVYKLFEDIAPNKIKLN